MQLVDLHGSEQCQGLASSSSPLFIIPSLQAINHQLQVEEDGAVESKFFSFHVLTGLTPALRGFREGVCASEWLQWRDLLFSPQRLSNQYLISPVFLSAKKKRCHRGKGPIDYTGLAFMIHTTEEEKDGEGKEEKRWGKRKWQKRGRGPLRGLAL